MEKRIALLNNGIVFNIVVAYSAEDMAALFNCDAIEVTEQTKYAHVGYGFVDGIFEQPPVPPIVETWPVEEEVVAEEE